MKKILKYENRKCDPVYWDISTPELYEKALKSLFEVLKVWQVYANLEDASDHYYKVCDECKGSQKVKLSTGTFVCPKCKGNTSSELDVEEREESKKLYKEALTGNFKAIEKLLKSRSDYEYEEWRTYNIEE